MSDVNRRDAVKLAAAAGIVAAGGSVAAADEKPEEKVASSGDTAAHPKTGEHKLDVSKVQARALANGLSSFFSRTTPDASPGRNILTISGLPAGTRVITVWITEWAAGNRPHAGGAFFYTTSVQLFNNGTQCRVVYNLDWGSHLPAGCQVIYGPG
ncbi:hypothetical protein J8F10_12765 [Gemmata sp. G18]|uniref:Twin-arginine translocation signal domain-containing protein n=1 Tax=Gemmata palustris TaxID=2822762 RepID=A0ABS5BQZ9_9BACT|nr:hypothetical protein [Gemmata palustris]MBP3956155.1 hypothetical protein [Gemmata palustris]